MLEGRMSERTKTAIALISAILMPILMAPIWIGVILRLTVELIRGGK
jgi:hypothetical protein